MVGLSPPRRAVDRRAQVALAGALIGLAAVAWLITNDRMRGMDMGPGTDPGALGFFIGVWVVMMAAMMFPSIVPMVAVYDRVRRAPATATALFVAGYLVTWTLAGLLGYAVAKGGRSLSIDAFSWDNGGRYLAGGVIVAAAIYQLTPAKDVCLRHCRGPLSFVMEHWRDGHSGALRMGAVHGAWCVGCCWALMAALFALGVMSIPWMLVVAGFIAVEKLLPWRRATSVAVALLLLAIGLGVMLAPDQVPGLTVPSMSAPTSMSM